MIDTYAWVSIALRTLALIIMLTVSWRQYNLLKTKSDVQNIKYLMIFLVAVIIFNHAWSLGVNFYRAPDGNLQDEVRHLFMIFNASSGLASAIGWHVLYRKDD